MPEEMRLIIMDSIRQAIGMDYKDEEQLRIMKRLIENRFDGKWQVVKGFGFSTFFDDSIFKFFL
jgi:hypothetical protein